MNGVYTDIDQNRRPVGAVSFEIKNGDGRLVAIHHRKDTPDGKRVWWTLPDGTTSLNGTPLGDLPLYGSHLIDTWDVDDPVIVVEGEKAAEALLDAGFNALGTVTGAGGTPGTEALEVLRGREVILWPDNDEPGKKHMDRVAERLREIAADVRVYTWHDALEDSKGTDAADHPAVQSRDPEAVDRLLQDLMEAPRWEPKDEHVSGIETFTLAELLAEEMSPVNWTIPDVLPEGVTLFAGKPKMGKTWLAQGLAVAVAAGGVALGTKPVEKGEVLYLALEDNRRRLHKRFKKLLKGDAVPEGLHVATECPRLDEGGVEAIGEWLEQHPEAQLVIVDTLAKVRPHIRGQNVYQEDYAALERLVALAAEYGVAILVVHHLRKMDAYDPLDTISGSTGFSGGVDGVLVLKRDRGKADAYLHIDGRDIEEPAELALTWDSFPSELE